MLTISLCFHLLSAAIKKSYPLSNKVLTDQRTDVDVDVQLCSLSFCLVLNKYKNFSQDKKKTYLLIVSSDYSHILKSEMAFDSFLLRFITLSFKNFLGYFPVHA